MKEGNVIQVLYHDRLVGRLALTKDKRCAFEYSDEWISDGFSISPFSLPLRKQVFVPGKPYFDGLFGVFADSLPDAWGRILLNRVLRRNGKMGKDLNQLERLSIVGTAGMGAITYQPAVNMLENNQEIDLDLLARQCKQKYPCSKSEIRINFEG